MRSKRLTVALLAAGALSLLAAPADAAPKTKQVVAANQDRTVYVTRDENGKTHTRIVIHKRSYLDPGTEPLPSERNTLDYIEGPTQHASSVLDNTTFGDRGGSSLPGPFTLPSSHNPWLEF
jgi:hypothetical protein